MTPFVIKKYDQDFNDIRELRNVEMEAVFGGVSCPSEDGVSTESTVTVTVNGSKDDGCD